jgi:CRP/FNR family transcriptional regulator, nitrogen fixation regulation protein
MLMQNVLPVAASQRLALDPKVSAVLSQSQPGAVNFYPSDATIYAQGDNAGHLYMVEFGTVRISRITADGRRQITSFCLAGDVFGLEEGDEHEFSAESVDGAGIRVLRPLNASRFAESLLSLALRRFTQVQKHILLLGRLGANEKMAHFLVDMMDRQGGDDIVNLPMQRGDIADYLGITFETVSRVLRVFKDRGIIRLNTISQVEILDEDSLVMMAA